MNRYPLWKYIIVLVALLLGAIYTLPNFFGESPAVQISSTKATIKVNDDTLEKIQQILQNSNIPTTGIIQDKVGIKVRFDNTDLQLKAKDILQQNFSGDDYVIALNLLSSSPTWLTNLHALPMYLGLDLRGGVHFLLQVDMDGAITKRLDSMSADLRSFLRSQKVRHNGINRNGETIVIKYLALPENQNQSQNQTPTDEQNNAANELIRKLSENQPDLQFSTRNQDNFLEIVANLKAESRKKISEFAI